MGPQLLEASGRDASVWTGPLLDGASDACAERAFDLISKKVVPYPDVVAAPPDHA